MTSDIMKAFRPLPKIKTERLILRRPYLCDTDDIFKLLSDKSTSEFEPWEAHERKTDTTEYLNGLILKLEKGSCTSWIIERKSDSRAIGMINLHDIAALSRRAEIGYRIVADCRRQGYAYEAAFAVTEFAFEKVGLNRLVGKCSSKNIPSAKLLQKLGMTYEGCHREELFMKNRYEDILIYAMLRKDLYGRRR